MAALDFLRRGGRSVIAAYFHHGTECADKAQHVVEEYCDTHSTRMMTSVIKREKDDRESREEYWRKCRYEWLREIAWMFDMPVITAHTIDDAIETWIM